MTHRQQQAPLDPGTKRDLRKVGLWVGTLLVYLTGYLLLYWLVDWGLANLHDWLGIDVPPWKGSAIFISISLAMMVVGPLIDTRNLWRKVVAVPVQFGMAVAALLGDLSGALLVGWIGPAEGGFLEGALYLTMLVLFAGVWLVLAIRILAPFDEPSEDKPELV